MKEPPHVGDRVAVLGEAAELITRGTCEGRVVATRIVGPYVRVDVLRDGAFFVEAYPLEDLECLE